MPKQPTDPKQKKSPNELSYYSGISFKMIAIILIGVFGGMQLDKYLQTGKIFTIVLSIVFVFLAMYSIIREFLKK